MRNKATIKYVLFGILICIIATAAFIFSKQKAPETEKEASATLEVKNKIAENSSQEATAETHDKEAKKPRPAPSMKKLEGGITDAEAAIENAQAALSDPETEVRYKAVLSLRQYPSPEALALLTQFLADPDDTVVNQALYTLGFIGVNGGMKDEAFAILSDKAMDKFFSLRGNALVVAATVGDAGSVIPIVEAYMADETETGGNAAIRALALVSDPNSIPLIAEILQRHPDQETLKNAQGLLAKIGTPEATNLLVSNLNSNDPTLQETSAWALSLLKDSPNNLIVGEAIASGQLDSSALTSIARSPGAGQAYTHALQSENTSDETKLALLNVLASSGFSAPGYARTGLGEAIKPLLNSSNPEVERAAIEALGKVASKDDQTAVIEPKLGSDVFEIQEAAVTAYANYMTPENYKALKKLWNDNDEKIRRTAFFLTEPFLNDSDREDLQKATQHSDQFISKSAANVIKYLDTKEKIVSGSNG